ncbi:MAG: hypothetical protein OMM_13709 [Candidatus Magnetoglobus multicellularis str. Araruama]|uniref:Uncharacterized protein n=1 Tax=Candidatus Magnetoglobus multicellularis str. Araruama TaxID=890399 RepID=A0A1V1NTB7_9BACT|nr:MAG: hypothetical protein OMM_13709 [Candidatus Magnetoglobus multicellularis str. Araruama]
MSLKEILIITGVRRSGKCNMILKQLRHLRQNCFAIHACLQHPTGITFDNGGNLFNACNRSNQKRLCARSASVTSQVLFL